MIFFYFERSIKFIVITFQIPVKNVFNCNEQNSVALLFIPVHSTIWPYYSVSKFNKICINIDAYTTLFSIFSLNYISLVAGSRPYKNFNVSESYLLSFDSRFKVQ